MKRTHACPNLYSRECKTPMLGYVAFGLLIGLLGCDDANNQRMQRIQARQVQGKEIGDSIREAFRDLPQLIRMNRTAALREIRVQLNTWSKSIVEPEKWRSAGLLESVSGQLRTIDFSKRLNKLYWCKHSIALCVCFIPLLLLSPKKFIKSCRLRAWLASLTNTQRHSMIVNG